MSRGDACVSEILPTVQMLEKFLDTGLLSSKNNRGGIRGVNFNFPNLYQLGTMITKLKEQCSTYSNKYKEDSQILISTYLDPR